MSIGLQCPGCGRRYRIVDDRKGSCMICQCGRSIRVEGTRYEDKLCAVCGIDVSSLTRTRNPQGGYYCQPCWDDAMRAKRMATAQVREVEIAWMTRQLSRLRFANAVRPLIVLCTLALLGLSWVYPPLGKIMGATLLVIGGAMLIVCTVWLYVIPFRDGASMGFACILSRAQRTQWARRNPEFNLRRPSSLVMCGLWIAMLSAAFFGLWIAALRYMGQ